MWLCVCDISPPPPAPPMRAAFSSWVQTPYPFQLCKTIVTSWKGLCGYDRDDMSCQDFCTVCLLRTFPSHYSICKQHVIRAAQHLHVVFSCFLIFFWWFHQLGILLWECYYILWTANPSSSLQSFISCTWAVVHLPKQYMFFEDCGQWVSSCWKSTTLFLFLMHLYSSTSDAEPGKAYRWRGAPVPCVCWYMFLQTCSQGNIVSRPHTLPMSVWHVWYDFHWHHLRRNRCIEPSVVAMQKIVSFCCDLYPMHHVCTCGLATGDTVCWS